MAGNGRIINPFEGRPDAQLAFTKRVEEFSVKIKLAEAAWTERSVRDLCPWWINKSMNISVKWLAKSYLRRHGFHIMHKDDGMGGRVHSGKWIIVWKEGKIRRVGHSYVAGNQYLMQEATEDEYRKVIAETTEAPPL